VTGRWDFLGELVDARAEVAATAERLPYLKNFAV
jgi:hypothetical protein